METNTSSLNTFFFLLYVSKITQNDSTQTCGPVRSARWRWPGGGGGALGAPAAAERIKMAQSVKVIFQQTLGDGGFSTNYNQQLCEYLSESEFRASVRSINTIWKSVVLDRNENLASRLGGAL
jgi:hypothetical protein